LELGGGKRADDFELDRPIRVAELGRIFIVVDVRNACAAAPDQRESRSLALDADDRACDGADLISASGIYA
jgi:hypothetical protein